MSERLAGKLARCDSTDLCTRRDPATVVYVEPWAVRETALDLGCLAQTESVFALSNGHLGLRANLDEGEPFGLPGTYLAGFYESRPLPYAEAGTAIPRTARPWST